MFYILHGDEEFLRSEEVARLKAEILSDGMGDLNITTLDGRRVDLRELMDLCSTLPFLTQRRLIIVEGLLQRLEKRRGNGDEADATPAPVGDEAERLAAYLPTMPDTTRLVFVEAKILGARHPILRLAAKQQSGYVRVFRRLGGSDLQAWLRQRATEKGAELEGAAAALLPTYTGNDLRRLDAELEKLAALAGYQRAITADDVRALVTPDVENEIWNLVDALGHRQGRTAMRLLQEAFQQRKHELYLLTMFARQVRLILGAKDLAEQGQNPEEIRKTLRLPGKYPVHKLLQQSRRFTMEELEAMLGRVLDVDQAIKTGRADGPLALEMLVLEVCARRRSAPAHQVSSRSRTRSARATSLSSPEPRSR